MTDADQETTAKLNNNGEEIEENKSDQLYGGSMSGIQEKYMYNLKHESAEICGKSKKQSFGSDSLILTPHDLRYNQRHNICNDHLYKKSYNSNTISDVRWKQDRTVNTVSHCQGTNGGRRWNPAADYSRSPFEMQPQSSRRKYLQRSFTSSEILDSNHRCLQGLQNIKPNRTSICNTNSYNGVQNIPSKKERNCSKTVCNNISEKETYAGQCKNVIAVPVQASSIYSSSSDASLDPKAPSIISTLRMGSQKPIDFIPGLRPSFGSQYSLNGNQCCPNCHMLSTANRKTIPHRWHSQSTVGEGHFIPVDGSNVGLSWRRLHMSRAKLKATATTSELLSGFAMVAMVELQINEPTNVPEWLFIMFSVCTTVLVAVHIFALMISTYLLPNIDAVSKLHSTKLVTESPHERMRGFVELAWAFSTVLGLFLFLVEVAILCWVKFWDFSIRAAMAATIIVIPVLIIFIIFVFHFYRSLVVHKCKSTTIDINELEEIRKKLDNVSPA